MVGHGRAVAGRPRSTAENGRVQLQDPVRTRPIHAVIRGAADKEPFAAALGKRLLHDRLTNQTARIGQYLGDQLRAGLSVAEAGQRYCALTSPELYYLLTVEFGWTADQHGKWLTELLEIELLGPRAS